MGYFVKVKCPVCGWQLSPGVFFKPQLEKELREVGLLFFSTGDKGIRAVRHLESADELEEQVGEEEKGVFAKLKERFLNVLEKWCDWGRLKREEVFMRLGLFYLGGGIWVERFERLGRRLRERVKYEFDLLTGSSKEISRKELLPVGGREAEDYEW